MARMLAFCAQHRIRLAHTSSELDAQATSTALGALAADPEVRQVLVRSALISSWLRSNRTGTAVHAPPESAVSSTLGNVFGGVGGIFNKVAAETKSAAAAMADGVSSTAAKLVEQVEADQQEEMEARHGSLKP